jgi:galactokinase
MYETHEGLSNLYEVSCPELDILVNELKEDASVLGARMMGGGFGGCTLSIINYADIQRVVKKIREIYTTKTGKNLTYYQVQIEAGAQTCH